LLPLLESEIGLTPAATIADVGSGTGIFSRLLLDYGCTVYAIEPNAEMRAYAEADLGKRERYHSIAASASATHLADASVDHVTAAQAFHWFDLEASRREFRRILRADGAVVLVYNTWRGRNTPFLKAYDELTRRYDREYATRAATPVSVPQRLAAFFGPPGYEQAQIDNPYHYSWEEFHGGALSRSYAPLPGDPDHEAYVAELRALFEAHAREGQIQFPYLTIVVWGDLR
jgi:SAM-dependent methyltransferase